MTPQHAGEQTGRNGSPAKRILAFASCLGVLGPALIYGEHIIFGADAWAYEGWQWTLYMIALWLWPTFVLLLSRPQEAVWSVPAIIMVAISIAANMVLWGSIGLVVWKLIAAVKSLRRANVPRNR